MIDGRDNAHHDSLWIQQSDGIAAQQDLGHEDIGIARDVLQNEFGSRRARRAEDDRDITRRETLDAMNIRLLIVTKDDFYQTPELVLARVHKALVERGAKGVRKSFRPEWRAHFAPRP